MTPEEFLDQLAEKELLPLATVEKLRKKTASSSKPLSAKSLARFLIDKGHLTKPQALAVLQTDKAAEPAAVAPADPSGVHIPMDDLQDLSSSAEWDIDEGMGGLGDPMAAEPVAEVGKGKKRKKKKRGKKENEWDSPLLLIGGGALALLLLVGGVIWYILYAEGADVTLAEARTAMEEGSYQNGIANYQKFVENWPSNANISTAKVELAMAQIRQAVESNNFSIAFETANNELRSLDGESAFAEAQDDLSDLLPRIARGLADKAEASTDLGETKELFEQAKTALGLANNTKYIPKSRRDNTELEGIRQTIERIERRQQSLADLGTALEAIDQSIAEKDTAAAYAAQAALVEKHPSLAVDAQLAAALVKISQAERESIHYVEEPIAASTEEPDDVVVALALAHRRAPGESPLQGVYCAEVGGVAYGIDTHTGSLIWRRYVGPKLDPIYPQTVDGDLLLIEWRPAEGETQRQAVVRVDARTGALKWRLELDDDFAEPVVSGERIYVAGASGKLHVIDAESGTRQGFVQFAQPLESPPAISEQASRIYLAGDHSSLYTISTSDLSCTGVVYSKHPAGSILAAPAIVLDKLIIVENDGLETCQLRLFAIDGDGNIAAALTDRRLEGRVVRQPRVDGRRFMATTDRGQVSVYEVTLGSKGDVLTELASRTARGQRPFVRFGAVSGSDIWFAESSLTKFALAPTGNRLAVQELSEDYNRSDFVAPLEVRDGVLLHVRSRRGRAGFTVTAANTQDGAAFWQTDIGAPPAGDPLASASPVALLEADANGNVYRFDPAAIKSRVQNEALPPPKVADPAKAIVYDHATLLNGGAAVFTSTGSAVATLYSPSGAESLTQQSLAGELACQPTAYEKGFLVPLTIGQVFYLDSKTGQPLAAPFQPALAPGSAKAWLPAAVVDETQVVITDGVEKVYLLEFQQQDSPALLAVSEVAVGPAPLVTSMVVLDGRAYAGTDDGRLAVFQLPGLDAGERMELGAKVVWGPYRVGDTLVVRTARDLLIAVDAQGAKAWEVAAPTAAFAGPPIEADGALVVASQTGAIVKISLADGSETGRVEVGQPLAGGPAVLGGRLVVAAKDGALLVVESP